MLPSRLRLEWIARANIVLGAAEKTSSSFLNGAASQPGRIPSSHGARVHCGGVIAAPVEAALLMPIIGLVL